jgi:hypothetical protein
MWRAPLIYYLWPQRAKGMMISKYEAVAVAAISASLTSSLRLAMSRAMRSRV